MKITEYDPITGFSSREATPEEAEEMAKLTENDKQETLPSLEQLARDQRDLEDAILELAAIIGGEA